MGRLDLRSQQRVFKRNDPRVIFILTGFISSNRTEMHGNTAHVRPSSYRIILLLPCACVAVLWFAQLVCGELGVPFH